MQLQAEKRIPRPHKAYFLVKINKEHQKSREEKTDSGIYFAPNYVWMTRCMQQGEVVDIGEKAHDIFPQVQIGHTLIFHHFVEGTPEDSLVHEDKDFNYYVVSSMEIGGSNVQSYGVWTGSELISHPHWVFMEPDPATMEFSIGEVIDKRTTVTETGIVVFNEWKEGRAEKEAKMESLRNEMKVFGKYEQNRGECAARQKELDQLQKELNTWYQTPYTVAGCNPMLSRYFDHKIGPGDVVYMRALVCQTKIEFMGKEYRVGPSEEITACYVSSKLAAM